MLGAARFGTSVFFWWPAYRDLRGAPPRAISDAKIEQKGAKGSQNGIQKGAKIMQNYLPPYNPPTLGRAC
jgi:hypothetical protein